MKFFRLILVIILLLATFERSDAFAPKNLQWGAGITIGEPLGATVKYWLKKDLALAGSIGGSYFGTPRITVDYLWHVDAFKSNITNIYFGPGGVVGFGNASSVFYDSFKGKSFTKEGGFRMGVRGIVGINIVPKTMPMEIFVEVGTLIGFIPKFRTAIDFAIGGRYYF